MSSNINPYNIDGTFPVAGQDNSSQGFRDNFTNIKNNFAFAQNEINDLQTKSILTAALTGQTINNDMAGTQIVRPQLRAWTQAYLDLGVIGETAVAQLDFNIASFYKCSTGDDIRLNLVNWPNVTGTGALGYGTMRVWIYVSDPSHTITLPSSVTIGVSDITGYDPATRAITVDRVGNYIFDFSSVDGGANYFIEDAMRSRASIRNDARLLGNLTVSGNISADTFTFANGLSIPDYTTNSISLAINNLINSAPGTLDTLGEIAANLETGGNIAGAITNSITNTNANVSAANINIATLQTQVYTNSNVASYLPTYSGDITAGNLTVIGNTFISNTYIPTSSGSSGNVGQFSYDSTYFYVCISENNWMRANLTAF